MLKIIPCDHILPFDLFTGDFPIEIDLVYANPNHPENIFGKVYHPQARLSGHVDLLRITLLAAMRLHNQQGWTLVLKDCLRPIEAQTKMIETPIVQANPHWLEEPRFLSSPGGGGHPRGMAIDVAAQDHRGQPIDFGTAFDHFSSETDAPHNPAHRLFPEISDTARRNRDTLEKTMVSAAKTLGLPLLPLPQEWWDFRFPANVSGEYIPLRDADLSPSLRMILPEADSNEEARRAVAKKIKNEIMLLCRVGQILR